jgi:hypothetical protein
MAKYDDDPNVGPVVRVGRSLLTIPAIIFFLPAGIICLCVYLKTVGRVITVVLMAAIGFFSALLYCLEAFDLDSPKDDVLIITILSAIVFAVIGWIFGWKKAIPLGDMSFIQLLNYDVILFP